MIKVTINDRYIRGNVVFENNGHTARMSYINTGLPILPLNSQYELDGKKWKVTGVSVSDYNKFVNNVDLELING